jgi:uncharacterized surface protein with fasciclin (FAS1) repeats
MYRTLGVKFVLSISNSFLCIFEQLLFIMKLHTLFIFCLLAVFTASAQKYTDTTVQTNTKEWQGLMFSSEKSIFQNIENVDVFSKAAPLFDNGIIADDAMLTAFIMTNSSFSKLKDEEQESLFTKAAKPFITYHFIPGRVDSHSLEKAVENGGGTAFFNTVLGERLGVKKMDDGALVLFDSKGNTATIIATDYYHKNGFFHIVDGLLLPSAAQ